MEQNLSNIERFKVFFFFPGDLVTPTGDREIRSSCGRLPENLEDLA